VSTHLTALARICSVGEQAAQTGEAVVLDGPLEEAAEAATRLRRGGRLSVTLMTKALYKMIKCAQLHVQWLHALAGVSGGGSVGLGCHRWLAEVSQSQRGHLSPPPMPRSFVPVIIPACLSVLSVRPRPSPSQPSLTHLRSISTHAGLCRMVVEQLGPAALEKLMLAHGRLPRRLALALHTLYLFLMADQVRRRGGKRPARAARLRWGRAGPGGCLGPGEGVCLKVPAHVIV
jgi:hypothetical protein